MVLLAGTNVYKIQHHFVTFVKNKRALIMRVYVYLYR